MSFHKDVLNAIFLLLTLTFGIGCLLPRSSSVGFAQAGLNAVFSHVVDLVHQDVQLSVGSFDEAISKLDTVVLTYCSYPFLASGTVAHLVGEDGDVMNPILSVGYVTVHGGSVILVKSFVSCNDTVRRAVDRLLSNHLFESLVTIKLEFTILVFGKMEWELWRSEWNGDIDPHQTMKLSGWFTCVDCTQNLSSLWYSFAVVLFVCVALTLTHFTVSEKFDCAVLLLSSASTALAAVGYDEDRMLSCASLSTGLGCLLSFVRVATLTLPRYAPTVCEVVLSLRIAAPHLRWFLGGIVPVFFGFVLSGVILFAGDSGHFGTIPRAAVTLFCAIFGDSLIDVFTELDEKETDWIWYLQSRVYFVGFLFLFITSVLNVGLSVMQDSHAAAKHSLDDDQPDLPFDDALELLRAVE